MRFIEPLLSLIFSNPKRKLVLTVIVSMLLPTTIFAQGDDGFLNANRVLSLYGFKGGNFDPSEDMVYDIETATAGRTSDIEGNKYLIDTQEEFLTAAYYCPVEIVDATAKIEIEKELPHTKQGAIKLVAMWLKKRAENLDNSANYLKIIDMIKEKSGLTYEDAKAYYDRAITVEILKWGKKYFPNYSEQQLEKTVLPKLIAYYQNPAEPNLIEAVKEADRSESIGAYINLVSRLDPWFGDKFNQVSLQLAYIR